MAMASSHKYTREVAGYTRITMCSPRGSISKIAMLLCVIAVRRHNSIAILLMDPRGIWPMKPNVFCKVFSTFRTK